ncbi:type II secretion system protein [Tissierella praeacuta]|uniref:type IV pilus modification PilV family protein n=1 Tax=Tissierella praeacuta TaxID=43131 RepID=UPI003342161E
MKSNIRNGFTLIEVVISIMLLGIISIAILPMFMYSVKYAKWNNVKFTALELAYTQVEWLKTLDYDDLGLDISDYSPKGKVNPDGYMDSSESIKIDNVEYDLHTSIYWEKDTSVTGEPVSQAMKKVDVLVEAKDIFSGKTKEYSILGTLISREGEREFSEPGYVIIKVYFRSANNPEKNVKVGLGKFQDYSYYTNTDNKGEALFGGLKDGEYKVEPVNWKNGEIMTIPNGVERDNNRIQNWKTVKNIIIPRWEKSKNDEIEYPVESFLIDFPGYIDIPRKNQYHENTTVEIKPTGESYIPVEGEDTSYMLLNMNIKDITSIKFWRLWNYEYSIRNEKEEYFFIDSVTGKLWDGKFDDSSLMKASVKKLDLAIGMEDVEVLLDKDKANGIKEIIIEFTSGINNIDEMIFLLNDIEVSNDLYSITQIIPGKNNKFRIKFDLPIEVNEDILSFKILNYEDIINIYGMSIAEEKSISILKLK